MDEAPGPEEGTFVAQAPRAMMGVGAARASAAILGMLTLLLLARRMGPAEFGTYATIVAVVVLARGIGYSWLRMAGLRESTSLIKPGTPVVRLALGLSLLASGLILGAAAVSWVAGFPLAALALVLLGATVTSEVTLEIVRGGAWNRHYITGVMVRAAGILAMAASSPAHPATILGAVAGVEAFVALLLLPGLLRVVRPGLQGGWSAAVRYGVPLGLSLFAFSSLELTDRILLHWLDSATAAGSYAAVYDLVQQPVTAIAMIVSVGLFPIILRSIDQDDSGSGASLFRLNGMVLLAVLAPVSAVLIFRGTDLTLVFLGAPYQAATAIAPWVVLAAALGAVRAFHVDAAHQAHRATYFILKEASAALLLNLVLNLLLIPRYGMMGAAIATLVAVSASLVIGILYAARANYARTLAIPWGLPLGLTAIAGTIAWAWGPISNIAGAFLLVGVQIIVLLSGVALYARRQRT